MKLNKSSDLLFKLFLLTISGLLFGFSFPPFKTGIFAAFAFIPLFFVLSDVDRYGKAFRYSYFLFFIANLISISWIGGFIHGKDPYLMIAGGALLFVHPVFLSVPILIFIFIRRNLSYKTAIFSFPLVWVSFEYLHSITEIAFPWLTLGNTQTYDLTLIQYVSYTGVYGISFWLLLLNVFIFVLIVKIILDEWKILSKKSVLLFIVILGVYFIPKFYGIHLLNSSDKNEIDSNLIVSIIQPNIDPWEKWEAGTQAIQLETYQSMTEEIQKNTQLIIWAETATPYYILMPQYQYYFEKLRHQIDTLQIPLLTGISDIYIYKETEKIPPSAKRFKISGERYDSYNSSLLLIPNSPRLQKYAKIRLVPFSERVPYADFLNFLNFLEWGVGIGGWGIGKDTTIFSFSLKDSTEVRFSNLICYESIYPGFVSKFVNKGAEFLTIITNDSWWGNTFGPYQHLQIAVLRAVENRRWIARCANGGISAFIDPYGRIYHKTKMYSRAVISQDIELKKDLTYYSKNGDAFSQLCLFFAAVILVAAASQKFYKKIRRNQHEVY